MERLSAPQESDVFSAGQKVRVLRTPHVGEIGVILELPGLRAFPSGIKARAARVQLESGEDAVLPLANLEVLA